MSRLYSDYLLRGGAVDSLTATVPAGFVWVVRDVNIFWPGESLTDEGYVSIVGVTQIYATGQVSHAEQWFHEEMRQVLVAGDELGFFGTTLNWYVSICGYKLTTP